MVQEIEEIVFHPDFKNRFFLVQMIDDFGLNRRLENLSIYHPFYHTIINQFLIPSDQPNLAATLSFHKELLFKHPDKFESWFFYWFYTNKSYKKLQPQYCFVADTKTKPDLSHPASVVRCFLCKLYLLQLVENFYIPIPAEKIFKYVRKDYRHFKDWSDLIIFMQFKSYLRSNVVDSLEVLQSLNQQRPAGREFNILFSYHLARVSVKCLRAIHDQDSLDRASVK